MTDFLKIPKGSRKDVILLSGPTERHDEKYNKLNYDFLVEFEGSPFTWSTTSQPRAEELSKFTLGSPVGIEYKKLPDDHGTWIFHHNVEESVESVQPLGESAEEVLGTAKGNGLEAINSRLTSMGAYIVKEIEAPIKDIQADLKKLIEMHQ